MNALCCIGVGLVSTVSGKLGVIAVTMVLRAKVARSASREWKLCTGSPSPVRRVICLATAPGERCAVATTLERRASAAALSVSSNSIGARRWRMCHSR